MKIFLKCSVLDPTQLTADLAGFTVRKLWRLKDLLTGLGLLLLGYILDKRI